MRPHIVILIIVSGHIWALSAGASEEGAASTAQPDTGSWSRRPQGPFHLTVYGRGSFEVTHNGDGKARSITYGIWNGSRAGIKADAAIAGEVRALGHLESGFGTEDRRFKLMQSKVFGRQAYGGVETPLGTVTYGRQYPVSDALASLVDIALPGALSAYKSQFYWQIDRLERSLIYSSPKLGGAQARVGYAFGRNRGEEGGSTLTTGVMYSAGRLSAGASLESWETSMFGASCGVYNFWNAAASYDLNGATVVAGFSWDDVNLDLSTQSAIRSRTYALGAQIEASRRGRVVVLQQVVEPERGAVIGISTVRYSHLITRRASLFAQANLANHAAGSAYGRSNEVMLGLYYRFEVACPKE